MKYRRRYQNELSHNNTAMVRKERKKGIKYVTFFKPISLGRDNINLLDLGHFYSPGDLWEQKGIKRDEIWKI